MPCCLYFSLQIPVKLVWVLTHSAVSSIHIRYRRELFFSHPEVQHVETMVEIHHLDAVVLLGSCDKIVPGMLLAAARLDIPVIFMGGGPMLGGKVFDNRKSDLTSMSEGLGMLRVLGSLHVHSVYLVFHTLHGMMKS